MGVKLASNTSYVGESCTGAGFAKQNYSDRYVWYVVSLLCAVNAVNYMDRMALAVLAPLVKSDLHLSDAQLGLLTGFAFAFFYAICGIPIARWADCGIRRNIIAMALVAWSIMTALCGAAQNFWHLLLARVGVGAGEAGSFSPGASLLCDYVPVKRRSGSFAMLSFGNTVGLLLGMSAAGILGEAIGWRWTFVVLGIPGIALSLLVRLSLREPRRGFFDEKTDAKASISLREMIPLLWRCHTYRLLMLFLVANGFVQYGLVQWWPSFYQRNFGLSLAEVGAYLGMGLGISGAIGVSVGGILSNKAAAEDVRRPLRIGAVTTMLALPTAVGAVIVPSALGSMILVILTGFFWAVSNGPVLASVYSVVKAHMRATAGSITISLISIFGIGLGPFCVGIVSDLLAPSVGADSLRYALLVPIGFFPVMAITLVAAARVLPNDLRAVSSRNVDDSTGLGSKA